MIIPHIALEKQLWAKGFPHVAGVDEAGKGPWAGPVSAGAVIIYRKEQIVPLVRDSKYMTALQREKAFDQILVRSSGYGIGIVEASEIDTIGINPAVRKAMLIALKQLENRCNISLSYVIVDGSKTLPLLEYASNRIKEGGLYHYSIAAGSVLAKVTRDRIMKNVAKIYPQYGFEQHVGYGTKLHQEALKLHGPCVIHRKSFAPIRMLLNS